MPLITVPKFKSAQALLGEKIDRVISAFAEILNGGLDRRNIASGTTFALAAFREQYSLCLLRGFHSVNAGNPTSCAVVPVDGKIVGVAVAPVNTGPEQRTAKVYVAGSAQLTLPFTAAKAYAHVVSVPTPISVTAGQLIEIEVSDYPAVGPDLPDINLSVMLALPHQT
jgi:hypothetical protein